MDNYNNTMREVWVPKQCCEGYANRMGKVSEQAKFGLWRIRFYGISFESFVKVRAKATLSLG